VKRKSKNERFSLKHIQLTKMIFSTLALFAISSPSAVFAQGGCAAQKIDFNCDTHKVILIGSNIPATPLNCGRSTPVDHNGTIGNPGRAAGTVWPSMRGAPKIDIGLGAVIMHTLPPKNGRTPSGYNTTANHTGCLNVSPQIMKLVAQCKGTPYKITFHSKKSGKAHTSTSRYSSQGMIQLASGQ
jgi:hypothetical protein